MPLFEVSEAVAVRVERLAGRTAFQNLNLSFNDAVKRLCDMVEGTESSSGATPSEAQLPATPRRKRAPSPDPRPWLELIPELKAKRGLRHWENVAKALGIQTKGDSARRKVEEWVEENKPDWPPVPQVEEE